MLTEEQKRLARHHVIDLTQCSEFVDSQPLKASMVEAAAFLKQLIDEDQ